MAVRDDCVQSRERMMTDWRDVLRRMTREAAVDRARSMVAQSTVYKLGKGGFRPEASLWSAGKQSDCSGFIAWSLGIPREFPPGSHHWLQTTTYWEGGGFPSITPFVTRPVTEAVPGDLLVYPDSGGRQGHIGMVTAVDGLVPTHVVHCSSGNFTQTGDAIRETSPQVFKANSKTRLMKVDFDALRSIAGIDMAPDDPIPFPIGGLRSLTLAGDPTLRLVAAGMLVLEPSSEPMGGINTLQEALSRLEGSWETTGALRLATPPRRDGRFDDATVEALKAFQSRVSLESTGTLDATTLRALDTALIGGLALGAADAGTAAEAADEGEAVAVGVKRAALPVSIRQDGSRFFARVGDAPEFYVGSRVKYGPRSGLANHSRPGNVAYAARDYAGQWGHWAWLLEPTAVAEGSGYFDRLNTYDSAGFTFGFLQYAAHVRNGDFVRFLRALLAQSLASAYFPDLTLASGRIAQIVNGQTIVLETSTSTAPLLDYLNRSSADVEEHEVINGAKLIHWCATDPVHRALQVEIGVEQFRSDLLINHKRYALKGRSDVTCLLIFDIHHQGRASVSKVRAALANATSEEGAWDELLAIGAANYPSRIEALRKHVTSLVSAGLLGRRTYAPTTNDFVEG